MPADPRRLAEEAIELARERDSRPSDERVISDVNLRNHASVHYGEIARALIEALDEGARLVALLGDHGLDPDSAVDLTTRSALELETHRARAAERDRDALLADLPHALNSCPCERTQYIGSVTAKWPEAHTAAIARLEERIK